MTRDFIEIPTATTIKPKASSPDSKSVHFQDISDREVSLYENETQIGRLPRSKSLTQLERTYQDRLNLVRLYTRVDQWSKQDSFTAQLRSVQYSQQVCSRDM